MALKAIVAALLLACWPALAGGQSRSTPPRGADYTLSPIFDDSELRGLYVTMRFAGDADGETRIELPGDFGGQRKLWQYLSNIEVTGAKIKKARGRDGGDEVRILTHRANAPVTVSYRVRSAYREGSTKDDKGGALIRPTWFASFGEALFAGIAERDYAPVRFRMENLPRGWRFASDLQHGTAVKPLTQINLVESTLIAGPQVQILERPIRRGTLRFASLGNFEFEAGDLADNIAQIISAQRDFWGDGEGTYTVTLMPLVRLDNYSRIGGTGRTDGFALQASEDADFEEFTRLIAHEH